ncbi:UNVERIFIED_CONTAM: hypothetical protein K2H54_046688 [Gekko kuhli]
MVGEPQFIDWEQDSDYEDDEQCDGSKADDTVLDISDTDSCANSSFIFDEEEGDKPVKVRNFQYNDAYNTVQAAVLL